MTFIDWSDAEGMFGLLLEFVADERAECGGDPERHRFLSELWEQLSTLESRIQELASRAVIQELRESCESAGREFAADDVIVHLRHCIEELERLEARPG